MEYLEYLKVSYNYYKYELETLNNVKIPRSIFCSSTSSSYLDKIKSDLFNKLQSIQKEISLLESIF